MATTTRIRPVITTNSSKRRRGCRKYFSSRTQHARYFKSYPTAPSKTGQVCLLKRKYGHGNRYPPGNTTNDECKCGIGM